MYRLCFLFFFELQLQLHKLEPANLPRQTLVKPRPSSPALFLKKPNWGERETGTTSHARRERQGQGLHTCYNISLIRNKRRRLLNKDKNGAALFPLRLSHPLYTERLEEHARRASPLSVCLSLLCFALLCRVFLPS